MPAHKVGFFKTFPCSICGKTVTKWVTPSAIRQNKKFEFCSRRCANSRQIRDSIPCPSCGKLFTPHKDAKYCSRKCFADSTKGRPAHNAVPGYILEEIKAVFPDHGAKPVARKYGMTIGAVQNIAYRNGVHILPDIRKENIRVANTERMAGDKNPNWGGGITSEKWGENWQNQRKACLLRDNHTCQSCGGRGNSVHHIKPRREFAGDMKNANLLSNLITLCPACHLRVDKGKIPCPIPISDSE